MFALVKDGAVERLQRSPPRGIEYPYVDGKGKDRTTSIKWSEATLEQRRAAGWYDAKLEGKGFDDLTEELEDDGYDIKSDHVVVRRRAKVKDLGLIKKIARDRLVEYRNDRNHDPLTVGGRHLVMTMNHRAVIMGLIGVYAGGTAFRNKAFPVYLELTSGDFIETTAPHFKAVAEALFERDQAIGASFNTALEAGKAAKTARKVRDAYDAFVTAHPAP